MFERMQLVLGRLMTVSRDDLRREDGQGATEYAMVVAFVVVGLGITLVALGDSIKVFLGEVGGKIDALIP